MTMTMVKYNKDERDLSKRRVVVADGRRGRLVKPAPRQSVVEPLHKQPVGHCKFMFHFDFDFDLSAVRY